MMKKIVRTTLLTALLASPSFAGKNSSNVTLSDTQKDTLVFIYQEEKVARDTYITLGNFYPSQSTFATIQLSEQKHIDSAQKLCEKYNADISTIDEADVGQFVVPVLQELYDTLVAQGSQSELSGLMVGEYIELTDIDDLEKAEIGMPADVVKTYENLKSGSYNHLSAFRSAIDSYNAR